MPVQIQLRRGLSAQWTATNPILAEGELAVETDTDLFKIGNGISTWSQLPYGGVQGTTGTQGIQGLTGIQGLVGAGTQGIQGTYGPQGVQGSIGSGIQGIAGVSPTLERHFNYPGILKTSVGTTRWWTLSSGTITKIISQLVTAPVGSSVVANIKKNGTIVHTVTIPENTYNISSDVNISISTNDYITIDISSIGSGIAGSDLVISFLYVRT